MSAAAVASHALLITGVAVVLASALGMVIGGSLFDRLHYLTAASSVGAPLVVAALALEQSAPGRAIVKLVAIGTLLLLGGPVVTMATGRAAGHGGVSREESAP